MTNKLLIKALSTAIALACLTAAILFLISAAANKEDSQLPIQITDQSEQTTDWEKVILSPILPKISDCTFDGKKLYGKVKFVTSFPDLKVQIVESFPDLKVKIVSSFPDDCGEWQIVESFPDLKVQIVESFPDIKIKYVDAFPGMP